MNRKFRGVLLALVPLAVAAGCMGPNQIGVGRGNTEDSVDLAGGGGPGDDGGGGPGPGGPDVCGDPQNDPTCSGVSFGMPAGIFPLQSDPMPNPSERDNGVGRDMNGWLGLDSTHAAFNFLWIANASDNGTHRPADNGAAHRARRCSGRDSGLGVCGYGY